MNAHVAVIPRHNILAISVSLLVFAIPLVLVGCGLTINSAAGSGPGQGTGSAGGSGSSGDGGPAGGQTIPAPGALQALTGCTNPEYGDLQWRLGCRNRSRLHLRRQPDTGCGEPKYKSNTIFWTSRENGPGQSILLTGAFTNATKTARLALIPPGTIDWQTLVRGSSTVIPTTQQGTTGLSFIIPANFSAGVYGFEIQDPSTSPIFGLANAPSLNWAIGVPSITDPAQALQHQVYDCGVEPGGILRIFGKNFAASDQVILQSPTGAAYSFKPSTLDTNSMTAPVPNTLAPGNYNVWVGSSPWDATSSAAAQITVTCASGAIRK